MFADEIQINVIVIIRNKKKKLFICSMKLKIITKHNSSFTSQFFFTIIVDMKQKNKTVDSREFNEIFTISYAELAKFRCV